MLENLGWSSWQAGLGILLPFLFAAYSWRQSGHYQHLPIVNGKKWYEVTDTRSKAEFFTSARNLLYKGREMGKVFRMICNFGEAIVLDPQYLDDVKNHNGLSFGKWLEEAFMAHIPGFESYSAWVIEKKVLSHVALAGITPALDRLVQPISDEVTIALEETLGHSIEWQEMILLRRIPHIVAQVSSRVFVGRDLCRDPQWLRIAVNYAADSVAGARVIARWPRMLQPFVHWFLPECRKVRNHVKEARELMEPFINQRLQERQNKQASREARDAIDWFYEAVQDEPFDPVTFQLTLAVVAIHSTSDMLVQALHDICSHPQLIDELRQEVESVFTAEGFKRSSVNNLRLMDSVFKESQRLKPLALVAIQRVATEEIMLSDGLLIPKGSTIVTPGYGMWDSSVYPDAGIFDGHRFLRSREHPEEERSAQLVTTGPNHLGFGHGRHACPGRFFAAMEAKIALAHLLLKYDLKLAPGADPKVLDVGFALVPDPTAKIIVRKRHEGTPLDLFRVPAMRTKQ